jgi:hypothetical protein
MPATSEKKVNLKREMSGQAGSLTAFARQAGSLSAFARQAGSLSAFARQAGSLSHLVSSLVTNQEANIMRIKQATIVAGMVGFGCLTAQWSSGQQPLWFDTQSPPPAAVAAESTNSDDSTPTVRIPWSTDRPQQRFSFAEIDSAKESLQATSSPTGKKAKRSLGLSPNVQRGALVTPLIPQTTPSLLTSSKTDQSTKPPSDTRPAQSAPANRTVVNRDSAWETALVNEEVFEEPRRVPAQLTSASRPESIPLDDLILDVAIPPSKLAYNSPNESPGVTSRPPEGSTSIEATPAIVALTDLVQSPSDRTTLTPITELSPEPTTVATQTTSPIDSQQPSKAINNRFTDTPAENPQANAVLSETSSRVSSNDLLSTEAMIGPMKGADQLFSRLQLQDDLRGYAQLAESGARVDAGQFVWMPTPYTWISPAFYHHPLYFEQPNLERYGIGRARAIQPLLSSIHFFGSIPLVPYKTWTHHPRERVYTLGQGRPGNCVPVQRGVILGQSTVGEVTMFWEECSGYR